MAVSGDCPGRKLAIPERHLGLMTAEEHPLTQTYLGGLADHGDPPGPGGAAGADADGTPPAEEEPRGPKLMPRIRLGVARDRAFCFYYPENFELLAIRGGAGAVLPPA